MICNLCPRRCGALRTETEGRGVCRMPEAPVVARAALHQWVNTITEAELRQFPNLKHITLMSSKPEQVLPVLERCGIEAEML